MSVDRRAAGDFARQLVTHLSSAMTVNALELGRRLGLLDALAGTALSIDELAEATGTQPRYLTEWAGLLVSAGVLTHDGGRYGLPPEHAAALVAESPYNVAAMARIATATAASLEDLETVFVEGGGISYDEQALDVDEVLHELSQHRYDALLVSSYLGQVPGLSDRLAGGARVLELGCGRGHAAMLMAEAFRDAQVVGLDISGSAIAAANASAAKKGIDNATFVEGSASTPPDGPWDVICAFDVIHDLADPFAALSAAHDALADDGLLVMIDSGAPPTLAERAELEWAPMMYGVSLAHCLTVSLAQEGEGLGAMWGREGVLAALDDTGFTAVETFDLKGDPMDLLYVARPA